MVDKVFENHTFRKLYHLFGGGLLILGLFLLKQNWFLLASALYVLAFLIFGRRISFAAIGIMLLLVLSNSKWITIGSSLIWLVGDGMAGLLGRKYGRKKWPWNNQKTILGTISFFSAASLAMGGWLLVSTGEPPFSLILLCFIPCLAASIVEILPITFIRDRKPDDNLTVILLTGLVIKILTVCLAVKAGF